MKRWEYCFITFTAKGARVYTEKEETLYQFNIDWEEEIKSYLKLLNSYGRLGWEVVTSNNMMINLLLKRDIDEYAPWEYAHVKVGRDKIMVVQYPKKKRTFKLGKEVPYSPQKIYKIMNEIGSEGWEAVLTDIGQENSIFKRLINDQKSEDNHIKKPVKK